MFALRSVLTIFSGLACLAGAPAARCRAQDDSPAPSLLLPVEGAVLAQQVMVRIGFAGKGPHGLADGTGIRASEAEPPLLPPRPPHPNKMIGPSDGSGLRLDPPRPRPPHFALVIDSEPPAPGSHFVADSQHIAFTPGNPQLSLILASGPHALTLVTLDRDGSVSKTPPPPTHIRVE